MPSQPHGAHQSASIADFEIKSANLSLVALVFKTDDLRAASERLVSQYGPQSENKGFFEHEPLVFDFTSTDHALDCPDLTLLGNAVTACGLIPVAYRGAPQAWVSALAERGWVDAPPQPVKAVVKPPTVKASDLPSVKAGDFADASAPVSPVTLVIDKPLRSGQKVYARGGDLVVLAMVNQGAEVVADGNIHVYAPLRGKAMAGARGNTQARIFSLCLEPELISIAGVYRTSETPLPKDIAGKAAQVRLSADGLDKLLIEALKT
jgi:septum site-determining protein MinC